MKVRQCIFACLWIMAAMGFFCPAWAAPSHLLGKEAPFFRVEAGDGKILDAKMIRGKIVILFYECKEVLPKSRPLKNVLTAFYREQPKEIYDQIVVLPIINATGAAWPFKDIWKSTLVEKSQKVGMTVYGDWDGKMCATYAMKGDDTNLLIMDKKGVIRFFQSGVIAPEKAATIKTLLLQIAGESNGNSPQKPKSF